MMRLTGEVAMRREQISNDGRYDAARESSAKRNRAASRLAYELVTYVRPSRHYVGESVLETVKKKSS